MQVKLKGGEIDVRIGELVAIRVGRTLHMELVVSHSRGVALTDALIAGLANGQTSYKLVGRYIKSPLRWCAPFVPLWV